MPILSDFVRNDSLFFDYLVNNASWAFDTLDDKTGNRFVALAA